MKASILIAGSGKMARDIGSFFLEREMAVFWVTRSKTQKEKIDSHLARLQRRRQRYLENSPLLTTGCYLIEDKEIPDVEIIIEATEEALDTKQTVLQALSSLITEKTLLFSNSSSLLPEAIHPLCLGAHFFYPITLTGLVELIIPKGCSPEKRVNSLQFLGGNDLDILEQSSHHGFVINRLLLPIQAACFQALRSGFAPSVVEGASQSQLISHGQLSLMDSIGLDTIHYAAIQYSKIASTPAIEAMLPSLKELLDLGKNGKKNGNGLLIGSQIPWPEQSKSDQEVSELQVQLQALLQRSCDQALERDEITAKELELVIERIFGGAGFVH